MNKLDKPDKSAQCIYQALKVLPDSGRNYLTVYPDKPFLYAERGDIYDLMNQLDDALSDYNSEIKLGEMNGRVNRGKLYLRLKKPELAIADLSTAIAKQPDNGRLYGIRTGDYKLAGKLDLAKKDTEKSNSLGRQTGFLE